MTNTTRRIYSVALMAALSLGLSGCWFNNNNDDQPTPSATSSASASASASASPSPSASPTSSIPVDIKETTLPSEQAQVVEKELEEKPLGIDIKTALKTRSGPGMTEVFPADTFNMEEGVRQVLNTYQDLVSISDFQKARPEGSPADREYLNGFEEGIHGELLENLKEKFDKGESVFPTADRDGSIGVLDGVNYHTNGPWISNYGEPSFGVLPDEKFGNVVAITGLRADRVFTVEGPQLGLEYTYLIKAVPSAEKWLIVSLQIENTSAKVLDE